MTGIQISATPRDSSVSGVLAWDTLAILDTTPGRVSIFVVGWIGIGVIAALILRVRGHEFRPYAALGAVLGPAFVFLAYDVMRRRESVDPITISQSSLSSGSSVLVVVVGDLEDEAAALAAIDALTDVGTVTAAVPVDYEVGERVNRMGNAPPESSELNRLAETLEHFSPGLMMLPGPMEKSIPEGVRETGADLVVIVGGDSTSVAPDLETVLDTNVIRVDT